MMQTLSKPHVAISLTLFSLAIAGLLMWYGGELPTSSFPAVNLTAEQRNLLALVNYVNAKGQEWSIPQGEYAFNVSSKSKEYPRFLSGDIDPLDVKVGDTQRMKIVVVDITPPKRVWAEIEHDAGKDTVPLTLTGTKAVARGELEKRPYLVDDTGKLISSSLKAPQSLNGLNDTSNGVSVRSVVGKLIARADAAGEAAYTYEGSWVVHDTHTKTYRTTFIAESQTDKRDTFTMAWSDPVCQFRFDAVQQKGILRFPCSPQANTTEGFDGYQFDLAGNDINMSANSKIVFNPGTSIQLTGNASISNLVNGAMITKGYLFYDDADGDRYTTNIATLSYSASAAVSGKTRAKDIVASDSTNQAQIPLTTDLDCYDSATGSGAANVHPGQTAYFGTPRGDGSFDYDCNGSGSFNPSQSEGGVCTGGSLETDGTQYTDYYGGCTNPVQVFYCATATSKACGQNFNPAIHLWNKNPTCGPEAYLLSWRPDVSTLATCR